MDQLHKRHGAHHHDNVKYGYIVFCASVVYALIIAIANFMYLKKWSSMDRPTNTSIWGRLRRVDLWWFHFGLWLIIVVGVAFFGIEHPIAHYATIAKRLGRLAYSLVPLDVLLVIRPSLLTTSYLEVVALHKWISRLIIVASFAHGLGYLVKWLLEGTFWSKFFKIDNLLGTAVLLPSIGLFVISMRPFRERLYRFFYLWHNFVIILFIVPMFWHARPGVFDFIFLLLVMLAFQIYKRLSGVYGVNNIKIVDQNSSSLQVLKVPKPLNYPTTWAPGAHLRLSHPMTNAKYWLFPSHPFTIASASDNRTLDLVVRKGFKFQVFSSLSYTLSSPSPSLPNLFFETARKVVILCGGSGISLGAPVFRELRRRSSAQAQLIWCVNNKDDTFVLGELGVSSLTEVYVTGNSTYPAGPSSLYHEQVDSLLNNQELVELQNLDQELLQSTQNDDQASKIDEVHLHNSGRPNLDEIFSDLISPDMNSNNWIVVCGPLTMIKEAKEWGRTNNVMVFHEHYGF